MAKTHKVAAGESLVRIAHQHGIADWRRIYLHPSNAALRELRPDPQVLAPDDEVCIPDLDAPTFSAAIGGKSRFVVRRASPRLRIHLHDEGPHRDPLADLRFRVEAGGTTTEGRTDENGLVEAPVPSDVEEAVLTLWPSDEDDEDRLEWTLRVGHLDPVDTPSGRWARLENLAFDCGEDDEQGGEATDRAFAAFREAMGIREDDPEASHEAARALVRAHRA